MIEKSLKKKVVVVGGGGHVGLPLSLILAKSKFDVVAFDHSQATVDKINSGQMPFFENEAANLLKEVLESGNFSATSDANSVKYADIIFVVIGTPVDEHLSPDPNALIRVINELEHLINPNQVIILRSTVFRGVSRKVFSTLLRISLSSAFAPPSRKQSSQNCSQMFGDISSSLLLINSL